MKKIGKVFFPVFVMLLLIAACTADRGDSNNSNNSSPSTATGLLTVILRPANDFAPDGGWKVELMQNNKAVKSENTTESQVKFPSIAFGSYIIRVTALDTVGSSLFYVEKEVSMKRSIQAFYFDIESKTPTINFSVVEKLPQEITKVVVKCAASQDDKILDYKNGESFSYTLSKSGSYSFTFSFQDNQGIEYFSGTSTVDAENGTKSVSFKPVQTKLTPLIFSLLDGSTVAAGDILNITCNSSVSAIYYTTDGSNPTLLSNFYNSGVSIDQTMTVKAYAYLVIDGKQILSDIKTASYTVDSNLLKAPLINGVTENSIYTSDVKIEIFNQASEGSIYYTLDGSTPTTSSSKYESPVTLSDAGSYALKAIVISGNKKSSVAAVNFEIKKDTVSIPVFNPEGKTYSSIVNVTISCSTIGASIYYTTDGSEPTESSTKYSGEISLTSSGTYTIKAIAVKDGLKSNIASAVYTLNVTQNQTEQPVITPSTGTFSAAQNVTITCGTSGADIYYTIDGSEPTESSTKYAGSFPVSTTTTVKAIAVKAGYSVSSVATSVITIQSQSTFDGIQIQVEKSLGYKYIYYWLCSNASYTAPSWPGVAMDDTYDDYYIFEFEDADSVNLLITKGNNDKLCEEDIKITKKGSYKITKSGAESSTYISKLPQPPKINIPSSAKVGGSFIITVTSSTALTSGSITIGSVSKNLTVGDNTFNVSDFTSTETTLKVTGSISNAAGTTPVNGSITISNTSVGGLTGDWNELRIYQVMVSSFQDGDSSVGYGTGYGPGPHNGDLQGIINALDYIKDLGMNAVWMTPIFKSDGDNQLDSTGYFCSDYFNVDDKFGGNDKFKELVEAAHKKDMYVILDGVFGHHRDTGVSKPSPNGKYPSGGSNPVKYPDSLDYYKEVAQYWIEKYKIDGWRFDQCYQVGLGDGGKNCNTGGHNYWYEIRTAIKESAAKNGTKGKDWGTLGYTVGEHWKGDAAQIQAGSINPGSAAGYGLQSCFDFPSRYKLVQMFAVEESKDTKSTSLIDLDYVYSNYTTKGYTHPEGYYPNLFITNHDLVRFGNLINWKYSENRSSSNYWKRHKVTLASIAAYTGPITIYYGDEYGMMTDGYSNGYNGWYNDNMARDAGKISGFSSNEQDLHDYVAKLMQMRAENEVVWNGKHTTLKSDSSYFVGKKTLGSDEVVFIINNGSSSVSLSCSGTDLITGEKVSGNASCEGLSARFIKTK